MHDSPQSPHSHPQTIDGQFEYLQEIKATFKDNPEVYAHFLGTLNDLEAEETELLTIICNVSELFLEHPALIRGFNKLLPQGYYVDYAPGDFDHHFVSVTLPSGDAVQVIGNASHRYTSAQPKLATSNPSSPPEPSRGRSLPPVAPAGSSKPPGRSHGIRKKPLCELRDTENRFDNPNSLASSSYSSLIPASTASRLPRQSTQLAKPNNYPQISRAPALLKTWDPDEARHTPVTPAISGAMAASDVVSCLVQHGCRDITELMDLSTCTQYPISTGGFGDIYRAKLKNGDTVAIKCMRILVNPAEGQKHLKHAAHEIYTWSKCEHRHILKLLGLVQFRGQIGMVSPWVARGSLNNYLAQNPEANRLQLCGQVAGGLAYLHQRNIVHGDLKGANVLVSDDGDALLTDFGNAVLQERTLQFTYTTAKTHLSPRWTAPELIRGEGTFSVHADIFALGMTILEIITGSVPYAQMNDYGVMYAIAEGQMPTRPEDRIPTSSQTGDLLWSILIRCWSPVPELRLVASDARNLMATLKPEGLLATSS
ncbi:kinase-like protein [Ceratobasidium sp. AG-I]|nr:kinase-like protein [Ceratobasidium sp. AG-I]